MTAKKKVIWQSKSHTLADAVSQNHLPDTAAGGVAYEFYATKALAETFDFEFDDKAVLQPSMNKFVHWLNLRRRIKGDVRFRDAYTLVMGPIGRCASQEIGLIHHIDQTLRTTSRTYQWYFSRLENRLQRLDLVVTVSKYWEQELLKLGCRQCKVIYNSFNPDEFIFTPKEIDQFIGESCLDKNKPIVYIGNAEIQKGVLDVYEALKDFPYTLVMTGPKREKIQIPVVHLHLDRRNYLRLLKACDVVLTMSRMIEGWNRTAHEAMLCKTPVIGSGTGGMKELLEGGDQVICSDIHDLPSLVQQCIDNKDAIGNRGHAFATQYDMTYFFQAWQELLQPNH